MIPENSNSQPRIDAAFLEVYRQAHESRRKWETYIWQWAVLLLGLAAVVANWKGAEDIKQVQPLQKLLLDLLTLFVAAIFLNVWRARSLMKRLEPVIEQMHRDILEAGGAKYPILPGELDEATTGKFLQIRKFSSTGFAVLCHAVSVPVFLFIGIYVWFQSLIWIPLGISIILLIVLVRIVLLDIWPPK